MLKPTLSILTSMSLLLCSSQSYCDEDINIYAEQTDELYRLGPGEQDGGYTSLGLSMIGWGIGLAAGIGILAALLPQSTSKSSSSSGK